MSTTTTPTIEGTTATTVAQHIAAIATALDDSAGIVATAQHIAVLAAPESEAGYAMSMANVAGAVSRARARLAHPSASAGDLDVLSLDDHYRMSKSTAHNYASAARRVVAWGLDVSKHTDALLWAYRLGVRSGSGDALATLAGLLLTTPAGKREAVAVRECRAALLAWGVARPAPADEAEPPTTGDTPAESDTESAPVESVPASGDVVVATIRGMFADLATLSPTDLAYALAALDAGYDTLSDLPAYGAARDLLARV